MQHTIYIADPGILAISIEECGEPFVDIKEFTELEFGPPPECELTKNNYTKMRKSIYEKLCKAQLDLPKGLKFRLYEGYRSRKVQQLLFDQQFNKISQNFPNWTYEEKFREATFLVSPVVNLDGSINIPPHNTGGAIDIEIITENGEVIDMGMTAKDWSSVEPELCITNCKKISKEAQENRQLLLTSLSQHGFVNYVNEWWHFSYGDRYWAYHQPHKLAIYGSVEL